MYFKYKVIYCDYVSKKQIKASGLVFAEYYSDAKKHLEDYYDADLIFSIKIKATDNSCPVYETKEKEI